MKRLLALLILFASSASAETYECAEHSHTLEVESYGQEHVNHHVVLDEHNHIYEIEKENWFIEKVLCSKDGFLLIASHVQYDEPSKKEFEIKVLANGKYEVQ